MNLKFFFKLLCLLVILWSCKQETHYLYKVEASQIAITDSLPAVSVIDEFIKPFRNHIDKDLDSVLAFAPKTYSKTDGEFNTAIGNFMADVVYNEVNPIFRARTKKDIDLVLLNHGGIRAVISKGPLSARTAYKVMPFENEVVVVALSGKQINHMLSYLANAKRAHPVSGLKLTLDRSYNILHSEINKKPIDTSKIYYVATSDYLYNGGDSMTFFKPNDSVYSINYKIRHVLIDYLKKVDTINPRVDDRFIMIK